MPEEQIINRVEKSPLQTINLEDFFPHEPLATIDIANQLEQGFLLREKTFRQFVKDHDWAQYKGQHVAITCTADAIIPIWTYMLISAELSPFALTVVFGNEKKLLEAIFREKIMAINKEEYLDAKIVIKGCSHKPVPESAYTDIVNHLAHTVSSIMYGEPCSTVPVFKKKKIANHKK